MRKQRTIAAVALIISIFMAFLPRIIPICEKTAAMTQPMRCFFAYRAELAVALLAAIVALSLFILTEKQGKIFAGIMLALLAVVAIILPQPWSIGICMHHNSPCHNTYSWTVIGGVVLVFLGLLTSWLNFKLSELEK